MRLYSYSLRSRAITLINRKRLQLPHKERPRVGDDLLALLIPEAGDERPAVFELDADTFAGPTARVGGSYAVKNLENMLQNSI
jgi:hypothetical protein